MKNTISIITFAFALALAGAAIAGSQIVTVMHKKTSIRSDKQFFAPAVATANYGDQLAVTGEKGGWYQVTAGGKKGWVHGSATAAGAVAVSSAQFAQGGVSGEDVALAGKGFNEKVEKEYQQKNPKLNFKAVDMMEKLAVDEKHQAKFIAEGKLAAKEAE